MNKFIIQTTIDHYTQTTIGAIEIEGLHFCWSLEDTLRPWGIKVDEYTAIPRNPEGYRVTTRFSPGFGREMLMLYTPLPNIPNNDTIKLRGVRFQYVYAHGGNTEDDTEGCILVAYNRSRNTIQGTAEKDLFNIVKGWLDANHTVYWIIK